MDNINFSNYIEIQQDYQSLQDNQYNVAYSIMIKASTELEYLGELFVDAEKEVSVFKVESEALEANKCLEFSKEVSVNRAEKMSISDTEVVKAKEELFRAKKTLNNLQNMINFLTRVYYDCQNIWKMGNRGYRESRG